MTEQGGKEKSRFPNRELLGMGSVRGPMCSILSYQKSTVSLHHWLLCLKFPFPFNVSLLWPCGDVSGAVEAVAYVELLVKCWGSGRS